MEKYTLPADIYDKVFIYIALETSKQAFAMAPEYISNGIDQFANTIKPYAQEVNEKLSALYEDIMKSIQDDHVKESVSELLDDDFLGIQRIVFLKGAYSRAS